MNPKVEWGVLRTGGGQKNEWCVVQPFMIRSKDERTFDKKEAVKVAAHLGSIFASHVYSVLKRRKDD